MIPESQQTEPRRRDQATQPAWVDRGVWFFVCLGIAVRLVRYLVVYPVWHDEAFLAVNFWDRSYLDLLRPLDYGQVAPWLFLAIERTAVHWLGYSEAVLRLFPTLCSLASVLLFRQVARQVLPGAAQVLAVGVFATSVYTVRHGAEIKPYASDLLVALILLGLALRWIRAPEQGRWWWILAATCPFLIPLSYPSVFVAGGIGAALGVSALRSPRRGVRLGCAVFGVMLVASFLVSYAAAATFQAEAMRDEYRTGCWAESFPPLDRPWMLPVWLLDIHAGTMMAYPAGDRHGGSGLTLLCFIAGCVSLYRHGPRRQLGVLVAPFGLGLLAAALGRYPYGGAPRIMQYVTPSICLLAGLGFAALAHRLSQPHSRRGVAFALGGLTVLGTGLIVRDLACPYRVEGDVRTREFARWLWSRPDSEGRIACLKADFGISFDSRQWNVGMSAVYLHHQRQFSSRHRRRLGLEMDPAKPAPDRPLRLVAFDHLPEEVPAFRQWLGALSRRYSIRRTEAYEVQPAKPGEAWLHDGCVVLELEPRLEVLTRAGDGMRVRR